MTSSFEKFPAEIKIEKVSSSILGQEFNLYFVSGWMDKNQLETIQKRMPVLSTFQVDDDKWVIATLINQQQLEKVYEVFTQLAKEWRGAYYVITNKFVQASKPFIEG